MNQNWNVPRNHHLGYIIQNGSLWKHNSYVDDRNHCNIFEISSWFFHNITNELLKNITSEAARIHLIFFVWLLFCVQKYIQQKKSPNQVLFMYCQGLEGNPQTFFIWLIEETVDRSISAYHVIIQRNENIDKDSMKNLGLPTKIKY